MKGDNNKEIKTNWGAVAIYLFLTLFGLGLTINGYSYSMVLVGFGLARLNKFL